MSVSINLTDSSYKTIKTERTNAVLSWKQTHIWLYQNHLCIDVQQSQWLHIVDRKNVFNSRVALKCWWHRHAKKYLHTCVWRRSDTEWVQRSLSLSLSLSLDFFNEIDVDAWEYERTPKYAPGKWLQMYEFLCLPPGPISSHLWQFQILIIGSDSIFDMTWKY